MVEPTTREVAFSPKALLSTGLSEEIKIWKEWKRTIETASFLPPKEKAIQPSVLKSVGNVITTLEAMAAGEKITPEQYDHLLTVSKADGKEIPFLVQNYFKIIATFEAMAAGERVDSHQRQMLANAYQYIGSKVPPEVELYIIGDFESLCPH
jgi:hypothetical protein